MTFLTPVFFWSFLALLPLAGIYFLKVRPRRKSTTAYFLWKKIFEEKRTSALFNRLRDLLSLLLMALAFSAIAMALTNPEVEDDDRKDLLILIDHSASMQAQQSGRDTHFAQAKERARDLVKALNGQQRAAVATVAADVTFQSHLTDNPRQLLEAIDAIEPTELPLNTEALRTIDVRMEQDAPTDQQQDDSRHRVLFLTDGAFAPQAVPEAIELIQIGETLDNAGLIAADLQVLPGAESRLGLYFQIASTFNEERQADLVVKQQDSGIIAKLIQVTITPGINDPEVFILEGSEPGAWIVELDLPDALAQDNIAYLVAQQPPPVRVRVATEDRYFMENSVLAFSQGSGLLELVEENEQLVLTKAASPDASLALIFQPDGESPWWDAVGDDVEAVVPKVMIKDHPALRYLDATGLPFIGTRAIEAPEDALILVESDQGLPLIYQVKRGGKAAVIVNLDPIAAELYFSAWFPVLVHGVATYLSGREESLIASYGPRESVPVPGGRDEETTAITTPKGETSELTGNRYGPLNQLGFHQLANASGTWAVGASLLSTSETMLGHPDFQETVGDISYGSSIALWLTVLAILVIVTESVLYHRRKVG